MTSWFLYIFNFLGTERPMDGAEHELPAVLKNLNIDDGPFMPSEFANLC